MSEEPQPIFTIEKIYVKDLSLEVPNAPQAFTQGQQPQLEVQLQQESKKLNEVLFEVTLLVTVTAKQGDKTMFLVELSQAGIFQIRNFPESDMGAVLGMACPNVLFPYAREAISDTVNRAGFPPVLLAPVNFELLYQQRMQQQAAEPRVDRALMRLALLLALAACAAPAAAGEFRSVAENATVMYDAPSTRAKKLFVASRYYPVEVMVSIDNWVKVRDHAGDLVWVERKALSERRTVVVTAALADARQAPNDRAPAVFQAQQGVALDVAELMADGWVKVRHVDGQTGFVRIKEVWGL